MSIEAILLVIIAAALLVMIGFNPWKLFRGCLVGCFWILITLIVLGAFLAVFFKDIVPFPAF